MNCEFVQVSLRHLVLCLIIGTNDKLIMCYVKGSYGCEI